MKRFDDSMFNRVSLEKPEPELLSYVVGDIYTNIYKWKPVRDEPEVYAFTIRSSKFGRNLIVGGGQHTTVESVREAAMISMLAYVHFKLSGYDFVSKHTMTGRNIL